MNSKIVAAALKNKNIRKIAIGLSLFSFILLMGLPIIFITVILSPVLLVIGFFVSLFGSGQKIPEHPLQEIASEISCATNIFDLNTVDVIESALFSYTYTDEELIEKSEFEQENNVMPFYSVGHREEIKERYENYYFDRVVVPKSVVPSDGTKRHCSIRYISDIIEDIQTDNPEITEESITNVVKTLKDNVKELVDNPTDYDLVGSNYKYGNSGIFPSYNYQPSVRSADSNEVSNKKTIGEIYELYDKSYGDTHRGFDFTVGMGTPVYSMTDGVVINFKDGLEEGMFETTGSDTLGNYVQIKSKFVGDENEESSAFMQIRYLHMQKSSVKVTNGQVVKRGDLIGYSGNSGKSEGAHLDVGVQLTVDEMGLTNEFINPYSLLLNDLFMNEKYKDIGVE